MHLWRMAVEEAVIRIDVSAQCRAVRRGDEDSQMTPAIRFSC